MSTPWILLDRAVCFRVSGKDARRYLHNRLSQDIRGLSPGSGVCAAALSAQGRVEGLFSVICEAGDSFIVVSDGGEAATLADVLKRFVVADRVVVSDISREVGVVHIGAEVMDIVPRLEGVGLQVICSVATGRISGHGLHVVISGAQRAEMQRALGGVLDEPLSRQRYDYLRWVAGCPVFPEEINDQGMLLEFGVPEALSFAKGCYVGQEVIERSDAIGKVPRKLERVVLEGSAEIGMGSAISTVSGEALGKVVSAVCAPQRDEVCLFALLRVGKYKEGDPVECSGRRGVVVLSKEGAE